ncbi:serine protease 27-like isoform X2 [Malaclemys terrapin pileata]|uniref:serine protease 27-like isoform X2 n=1 Tax=Malaclemys terrapin pileata TaxID=2991368 RepID=UPI0023A8B5E4|nr:serine protease 27-like isoform X2 [Malaclemys terrapin pileata]
MHQQIVKVSGKQLVSGRIFSGQDAKDGAWPWQVSVQRNGFHICGGSLISESWVVSGARCFNPSVAGSSYRVLLGENRIFGQNRIHSFSLVKRIILHPSYDNVTLEADIALVELKNPIAFTATISPVGLLDASVRVPAGETCWVTGWGNTSPQMNSSLAETLQELEVLTVDSTICNDHIREALKKPEGDNPIKDDMICAGSKEGYKGFAWGDGGGPLVCKKDRTWYLAGIASWFLTTTVNGVTRVVPGYPGVYNRLNSHNDWIKANVPGVTFIPNSAPPTGTDPSATILRVLLLTMFLQLTL